MFEFDEKCLYPLGKEGAGKFPPEKPRFTFTEEAEHTAREMRETIARLLAFEKRLETKFEDLMKHLTSDNVIFKDTFATSHRTFLEAVKNEVNIFEGNVDNSLALFRESIKTDYAGLSEECATQIQEYYQSFTDDLAGYKAELNETYDDFRTAIESRIEQNNSNFVQSVNDFTTAVNRRITEIEKSLNQSYANFVNQVNNTITLFKNSVNKTIDERFSVQDSKINDAVLYLKTNLFEGVESVIEALKDSGELEAILNNELLLHVQNDYINVIGIASMEEAVSNCKTLKKVFYVPSGKTLEINSPLDLTGVDVIVNGTIQQNHNGTGVIIGDNDLQVRNVYIREILNPNYKTGDISVQIQGVKRAKITIDYAPVIRVYANGDNSGISSVGYSTFNILCCRQLLIEDEAGTTEQGWINENIFNVSRVLEKLAITGNTYQHNNNVFNKPCIEGGSLILKNCRRNVFYNLRNENMKEINLDSSTWQNKIIYNYHTGIVYNRGSNFVDNGRDNMIESETWQNNKYIPVCTITAKSVEKGMCSIHNAESFSISGNTITPTSSYKSIIHQLEIPAKYIKRIRATTDTGCIRIRIALLDENGAVITGGGNFGGESFEHPVFYYGVADSKITLDENSMCNPNTSATSQTVDILNTNADKIRITVQSAENLNPFTYMTLLVGCSERDTAHLEYLKYYVM